MSSEPRNYLIDAMVRTSRWSKGDADTDVDALLAAYRADLEAKVRALPSGTICLCGRAKDYHRPADRPNHAYGPRYSADSISRAAVLRLLTDGAEPPKGTMSADPSERGMRNLATSMARTMTDPDYEPSCDHGREYEKRGLCTHPDHAPKRSLDAPSEAAHRERDEFARRLLHPTPEERVEDNVAWLRRSYPAEVAVIERQANRTNALREAEVHYDGQHDDCVATIPHWHQRPYRHGDWSAAAAPAANILPDDLS